jgi:hypothetical protein
MYASPKREPTSSVGRMKIGRTPRQAKIVVQEARTSIADPVRESAKKLPRQAVRCHQKN